MRTLAESKYARESVPVRARPHQCARQSTTVPQNDYEGISQLTLHVLCQTLSRQSTCAHASMAAYFCTCIQYSMCSASHVMQGTAHAHSKILPAECVVNPKLTRACMPSVCGASRSMPGTMQTRCSSGILLFDIVVHIQAQGVATAQNACCHQPGEHLRQSNKCMPLSIAAPMQSHLHMQPRTAARGLSHCTRCKACPALNQAMRRRYVSLKKN